MLDVLRTGVGVVGAGVSMEADLLLSASDEGVGS